MIRDYREKAAGACGAVLAGISICAILHEPHATIPATSFVTRKPS
jgi:hypothetical protein